MKHKNYDKAVQDHATKFNQMPKRIKPLAEVLDGIDTRTELNLEGKDMERGIKISTKLLIKAIQGSTEQQEAVSIDGKFLSNEEAIKVLQAELEAGNTMLETS